jgi:hypothetical protein
MVLGISGLGIHGYRRNLACVGSYKFRAAMNSTFQTRLAWRRQSWTQVGTEDKQVPRWRSGKLPAVYAFRFYVTAGG